jgi:hypothetical protein
MVGTGALELLGAGVVIGAVGLWLIRTLARVTREIHEIR